MVPELAYIMNLDFQIVVKSSDISIVNCPFYYIRLFSFASSYLPNMRLPCNQRAWPDEQDEHQRGEGQGCQGRSGGVCGFRKNRRAVGEQPSTPLLLLHYRKYHWRARSQNWTAMALILRFGSQRQTVFSMCLVYAVSVSFHSWFTIFMSRLWNCAACLNAALKPVEEVREPGALSVLLSYCGPICSMKKSGQTGLPHSHPLYNSVKRLLPVQQCRPSHLSYTSNPMLRAGTHRVLQSTGEDVVFPLASYWHLTETPWGKKN